MSMRAQFDQLNDAYAGAIEAGDAEALSRLFTEDAIHLSPGSPPITGRQAIREVHEQEFAESQGGYHIIITVNDFREQGDTAYATGTWEADGETGNWLDVMERQADDSLQYSRVCWNVR